MAHAWRMNRESSSLAEPRYEADKKGVSKDAVKEAVKEAGNSRTKVEEKLDNG